MFFRVFMILIALSSGITANYLHDAKYINTSLSALHKHSDVFADNNESKKFQTTSKSRSQIKHDFANRLNSNSSDIEKSIPGSEAINLFVVNEANNDKFDFWKNQMQRHSYSFSASNQTMNNEINSTQLITVKNETHTIPSPSDLETSDSRFKPHIRINPSSDDEYDQAARDDLDASTVEAENPIDEASSNLSEMKVVKELTKFLSKGMSGATDQVKMETLENLKKRQRDRKMIKDNRAKLFEDLLTTAINNHPEKVKKSKRQNHKDSGSNLKSSATFSSGSSAHHLPINSDVDPELATDAETVLQHLQGLATAIDGPISPNQLASSASLDSPASLNEGDSSDGLSSQTENDTSEQDVDEKQSNKKPQSTSERPIVRQFKKIKNQLSQRRKQLDQIKKLFNIELALNPKDGSLMGKQVSSSTSSGRKKYQPQSMSAASDEDVDDSAQDSSETISNKRIRLEDEVK